MLHLIRNTMVTAAVLVLASCAKSASAAHSSGDEAAVRAMGPAFFKAYNAGDVDGVVALYAEDAVVSPPGVPSARGKAALRDAMAKDISASAGYVVTPGSSPDYGFSGDLAWDWNTFTVADKSGKVVDTGKYVTVYGKKDGKWYIVRDIWNSDNPPPAAQ